MVIDSLGKISSELVFGLTSLLMVGYAIHRKRTCKPRPFVVAITGGPCGGKSTILSTLKTFMERDLKVFTYSCPECPTMLILNGASYPGDADSQRLLTFETSMLNLQLTMEDSFINIATTYDRPSVIFCDRGACDISAYLPRSLWKKVMAGSGYKEEALLDRYDAIVHLVTTAEGAEKFYTSANNQARTETLEEAKQMEIKTRMSWSKHKNRAIIENGPEGMKGKIEDATSFIAEAARKHFLSGNHYKLPGNELDWSRTTTPFSP